MQAVRRPVTGAGGAHIARHVPVDSELRRRVEPVAPRKAPPRRVPITRKPVSRVNAWRTLFEQNLLLISSSVLLVTVTGWGLALYSEFRTSGLIGPSSIYAETARPDISVAKSDPFAASTYAPSAPLPRPDTTVAKSDPFAMSTYASAPRPAAVATAVRESPASVIARDWSYFEPKRIADVPREPATPAKVRAAAAPAPAPAPAPVRTASIEPVHTASIEKPAPQMMLASAPNPVPNSSLMPV
ncbi:MAG TPA: hypothetical protein VN362_21090, partial [Xanthobacteraceae bacterium]|nr:hypothetical protein [Xanthobacteraceae bacterium]